MVHPVFKCSRLQSRSGFTLVELAVAMAIVGLLLAVSVPASVRFYDSMQYRQAVRDVLTTLASARFKAVTTGRAQDVALNPGDNVLRSSEGAQRLPADFNIVVHSAREVKQDAQGGVIRFYPEGGSSGGDIEIAQSNGSGVRISVDWLVGRVTQKKYAVD
jgi:general secretion pathway protein H